MQALLLALMALAYAASAQAGRLREVTDPDAPRALPVEGPVSVHWGDPAQFTDIRYSRNPHQARKGDWIEELALHLRARATRRLPAGERLDVEITDIQRAGEYEAWRGSGLEDARIMRDLYPPRMTLLITRHAADGTVLAQGERRLVDPMYLQGAGGSTTDPLRYEKRLIDQWLARELPPPAR